jgi:hypothetical protein
MRPLLVLVALVTNGCVHVVHTVAVHEVSTTTVADHHGPVKVQLADGSTIVFSTGASVGDGQIIGHGSHYSLDGTETLVTSVGLDSVRSAQTFVKGVKGGQTAAATGLATVGAILVGAVSCIGPPGAGCDPPIEPGIERHGTRMRDFPYATTPHGATASVEIRKNSALLCATCPGTVSGELLAVDDTALVLLKHTGVLTFVPHADAARLTVLGLGEIKTPSDPQVRARIRLVSRFPAGLSDSVLQQLREREARASGGNLEPM